MVWFVLIKIFTGVFFVKLSDFRSLVKLETFYVTPGIIFISKVFKYFTSFIESIILSCKNLADFSRNVQNYLLIVQLLKVQLLFCIRNQIKIVEYCSGAEQCQYQCEDVRSCSELTLIRQTDSVIINYVVMPVSHLQSYDDMAFSCIWLIKLTFVLEPIVC